MAQPKDYRHIRIDIADNGLVVEFTEVISRDPGNPAADTMHKDHKEIYDFNEVQKAINRVLALKGIDKSVLTGPDVEVADEDGKTKEATEA